MDKKELIKVQTNRNLKEGRTLQQAVAYSIFNHGVELTTQALGLKTPRIHSIFFRSDCWQRCQLAAEQMLR